MHEYYYLNLLTLCEGNLPICCFSGFRVKLALAKRSFATKNHKFGKFLCKVSPHAFSFAMLSLFSSKIQILNDQLIDQFSCKG